MYSCMDLEVHVTKKIRRLQPTFCFVPIHMLFVSVKLFNLIQEHPRLIPRKVELWYNLLSCILDALIFSATEQKYKLSVFMSHNHVAMCTL